MKKHWWLAATMLASSGAHADDPAGGYFDETFQCPGVPQAESATVMCNEQALKKADRELNEVYADLIALSDENERTDLQDMQRAWIGLKQAQCRLEQHYFREVSFAKWVSYCEAAMTIRRVRELKALGTGIKWREFSLHDALYKQIADRIESSTEAAREFGPSLLLGEPQAEPTPWGPHAKTELLIGVRGSLATGKARAALAKRDGHWIVENIAIEVEGKNGRIAISK
jgi:uncharacterized protein YecT (DUF1311 family)